MTKEMQEIIERYARYADGDAFKYQLLGRMESDCKYFLGYGNRNPKKLWSGSTADHIADMAALYDSFAPAARPQWIDMETIRAYGKKMRETSPAT